MHSIITPSINYSTIRAKLFFFSEEPEVGGDERCYRANGFFNHENPNECGKWVLGISDTGMSIKLFRFPRELLIMEPPKTLHVELARKPCREKRKKNLGRLLSIVTTSFLVPLHASISRPAVISWTERDRQRESPVFCHVILTMGLIALQAGSIGQKLDW